MAHSPEFIARMKERLLEEKVRLERDLGDLGDRHPARAGTEVTYPESGGSSDDDNAAEVAEYSDELSLDSKLKKELQDVLSALKAIENGKYGICKYCGKDIQEKRLEARPSSSSCIACKKLLTQEL
jgi:RNA polymerase-binding protein DksA